jgi:TfoX/Sxy family transcriptional regulator of competence genes
MAYNEDLVYRIRQQFSHLGIEIVEKKMFGGMSFLYQGKMTVGVIKEDLVARVILEKHPDVLDNEFIRPMDFTGKSLKDFLYVNPDGVQNSEDIDYWIDLGLEHAKSKLKK